MPKTARRGAEIGRWRRRRKNENGLTNNHLGKRTSCERRGGGGTLLNEIWDCDDVVLPQAISAATLWCRARCCLDMSVRLCVLPAHSFWSGLQSSARRIIQTSSRVASPCPMQGLCEQRWKITPHTRTTEVLLLSLLLWTEIWEADRNAWGLGHGWAQNRSQCVDRSVQLVLIPVHAYNCFCFF